MASKTYEMKEESSTTTTTSSAKSDAGTQRRPPTPSRRKTDSLATVCSKSLQPAPDGLGRVIAGAYGDGDGEEGSEPATPGPPLFSNSTNQRVVAAAKGKRVAFMVSTRRKHSQLKSSKTFGKDAQRPAHVPTYDEGARAPLRLRNRLGASGEPYDEAENLLHSHVEKMWNRGMVVRHAFKKRELGFSVSLDRIQDSDRIVVRVKETRPECEIFGKLLPSDELVAINGEYFVPTRLLTDFEYLKDLLSRDKGPRPLDLVFVRGDRRNETFDATQFECTFQANEKISDKERARSSRVDSSSPLHAMTGKTRRPDCAAWHGDWQWWRKVEGSITLGRMTLRLQRAERALREKIEETKRLQGEVSRLRQKRDDKVAAFSERESDLRRHVKSLGRNPAGASHLCELNGCAVSDQQLFLPEVVATTARPEEYLLELRIAHALEAGDARSILRQLQNIDADDGSLDNQRYGPKSSLRDRLQLLVKSHTEAEPCTFARSRFPRSSRTRERRIRRRCTMKQSDHPSR